MGSDASTPITTTNRPYLGEFYAPVSGQRSMSDRVVNTGIATPSDVQITKRRIISTAFNGVWSILYPESLSPQPRIGECSVYSPELDSLVIAYGSTSSGQYFNDAWILDFSTLRWKCLSRNLLSPRSGARATLVGDKMWIFGGGCDSEFFADLHVLDIKTGQIENITTFGPSPSPRTQPCIAANDNELIIWGGFNGLAPSELSILDFKAMTWKCIEIQHTGRSSASYSFVGNTIWIFGSSRTEGMATINLDTLEYQSIESKGTQPNTTTHNAAMIAVDRYLITFGGTGESRFTHVYAFDRERKWWFIFHVKPDDDTVSVSDGEVTEIGLFMLPREHSYSACYRKQTRQIIAVCGSNEIDPPPIFAISIGDALSILHLRNDMLAMLDFSSIGE